MVFQINLNGGNFVSFNHWRDFKVCVKYLQDGHYSEVIFNTGLTVTEFLHLRILESKFYFNQEPLRAFDHNIKEHIQIVKKSDLHDFEYLTYFKMLRVAILIERWERNKSKCFFTYIHLDLFHSHPSIRQYSFTEWQEI